MDEKSLAINSIVYIMIFIFPGFLFRKFLFRREFSKEFDKGNLFERTVLTLFLSVLIIGIVSLGVWILKNVFNLNILSSLTYGIIVDNYDKISKNQIPTLKRSVFIDFLTFVLSIYSAAIFFGYITYKISLTKISRFFGLFKFDNYWHGVINGHNHKNDDDTVVYAYTVADILVDAGGDTVLYSGQVVDYFVNRDSLDLQTIVLSNVKKYSKSKQEHELTFRSVPGNNMAIEMPKIININFSYIYDDKEKSKKFLAIYRLLRVIRTVLITLVFFAFFVDNVYLSTFWRKLVFVIFTWSLLICANELIKNIIFGKSYKIKIQFIFFIIILALPYVWIFNIFGWWVFFGIWWFLCFVLGMISAKTENKKESADNKDIDSIH